MSLIEQAKKDIEQITSNVNEFGVELNFIAPNAATAKINGLHAKTFLSVNNEGIAVNSKQAHVSFSEKFLLDKNYPVRNTSGEVDLTNHLVNVKDSTGIIKHYKVQEWFPDETIGLITCILNDYE